VREQYSPVLVGNLAPFDFAAGTGR